MDMKIEEKPSAEDVKPVPQAVFDDLIDIPNPDIPKPDYNLKHEEIKAPVEKELDFELVPPETKPEEQDYLL